MLGEHVLKAAARSVSCRVPYGGTIAVIVQPKIGALLQEQAADVEVASLGRHHQGGLTAAGPAVEQLLQQRDLSDGYTIRIRLSLNFLGRLT